MSRQPRVVAAGHPHHVVQYTNRREALLAAPEEQRFYLENLRWAVERRGVRVLAYVVMPDHIHLLLVPQTREALGAALRDVHSAVAMEWNRRSGLRGHVWQARFYSCPLDHETLPHAVRYLETNPLRCGVTSTACGYQSSSAAVRAGREEDGLNLLSSLDFEVPLADDWEAWLRREDPEATAKIRSCTRRGYPCGSSEFIERLERELGRSLHVRPRGRPRRTTEPLTAPATVLETREDSWRYW